MAPVRVIDYALAYRELGFSVIPIAERGKEPHFSALRKVHGSSEWARFRDERATIDQIHGWYDVAPSAGVAIITGSYGDLVVADFDVARPARIPITPVVATGSSAEEKRRLHVYLRGKSDSKRTAFGDLKAQGGYVVAPPSEHRTGVRYEFQISPPGFGGVFLPEADLASLDESLKFFGGTRGGSDTHYTCVVGVTAQAAVQWCADTENSDEFARRALEFLGIRYRNLTAVHCPFHDDARPSAGLIRGQDGNGWVLSCRACVAAWKLGTVYAKLARAHLSEPTIGKYWRRLCAAINVIKLPPLPLQRPDVTGVTAKFTDGYLLALQIEAFEKGVVPEALGGVPFAKSFGAPWCDISESSFTRARGELLRTGWLTKGAWLQAPGHPTRLWLPAEWLT
jgi:Bifunctional DNA primase/polymerase, N-terminal